ncbi:Cyclic di-GMP phosphodiesterase response regulator RpfG [Fervidicola ferrireducens]|uniref:Cyclic di-GMP phosphodiesterase response regulator RpfG n=1 Tax=Fervidicola ferrireducens TaxID=520764 RepID=A0A140L9U7_9FIRM|nr:HD-GYP domain-containing protein [Fervidicola ferrireducens]KXG77322.1 Cyclic di-GMP phosphodiesterase response regulator RpfG [Fervidicola ferrireducens]
MLWNLTLALFYVLLARDRVTAIHCKNVAKYAAAIGNVLGLSPEEIKEVYIASLLHDVGKIGLPDRLLKTTRKYTRWEKQMVQQHVVIGRNLLASLGFSKAIVDGVYYHHERYDGMGYIKGLIGDQIPLFGRIIAIADTFDALTSKRPYRDPLPVHQAIGILKDSNGQFDPELLKCFLQSVELLRIDVR